MTMRCGSFGRTVPAASRALSAGWAIARIKAGDAEPGSMLGHGNGRSYGDSCLNPEGLVADMRELDRIVAFDAETGVLEAEAGVLLADVIAHAAPHGYFPPVVPGTQYVTLGGAIANDVHGKNHHRRGTFGRCVESLTLLRSDGVVRDCSPAQNRDLFAATIGGMGLTGLILVARIRLMKVPSLDIVERVAPFRDLEEYFELAEAADAVNEYAVAWVDQVAGGRRAGRGLLLTGNHAGNGRFDGARRPARLSVPFTPPFTVLNRPFLSLFNAAYRAAKGVRGGARLTDHRAFFFPLDGVRDWNRLYGPRGLHQHQSVIPAEAAREVVPAMLAAAQRAGQGSFLTVLKRFGDVPSPGLLSFPRSGYTLTLDFPHRGGRTLRLLDELDRMTITAGGAVNPYKDARMSPQTFAASFPDWRRLEAMRDPAFISGFWQRTAARLPKERTHAAQAAE